MKYFLIFIAFLACNTKVGHTYDTSKADYTYLALGDSYTKGESVCESCGFPVQLVKHIEETADKIGTLKRIAQTGWTTTNLQRAINKETLATNFDLVTILIGVNNQYQNKPFELYEQEFPELLNQAIAFAGGDPNKVVVLSIPDYAFTPFGERSGKSKMISEQLDRYNQYAAAIAAQQQVVFLNITDITRRGLEEPALVAQDGLHPSEEAYKHMVDRLAPLVLEILD